MQNIAHPDMIYRNLGRSGLKISAVGFGNWLTNNNPETEAETLKIMQYAFDNGVNFFDTAEVYGAGVCETVWGNIFKKVNWPRKDYVLSTKIYWNGGSGPNDRGLCRKHIFESIKASLKRLQHEYVDVVFCHRFDTETPVEEVCRAFNWIIDQGYAFYWATSEWEPDQIQRAMTVCEQNGWIAPIADQCQYNLFNREKVDVKFGNVFDEYDYGTTVWSPLAGGLLTGKYNEEVPSDSRFASLDGPGASGFKALFSEEKKAETQAKLKALGEMAKELECSQAALALAWNIKSPNVTTAIVGATKVSQIEDNLTAIAVSKKLTQEHLDKIEEIFKTRPEQIMDWRNWRPLPNRR